MNYVGQYWIIISSVTWTYVLHSDFTIYMSAKYSEWKNFTGVKLFYK